MLYPETAVAIAVTETGHFRARKLMKDHNWFGFKPNRRALHQRIRDGYNVYSSPERMLADYQQWEWAVCLKYRLNDERAFRQWIVRHYAADPQYGTKLRASLAEVQKTWQ